MAAIVDLNTRQEVSIKCPYCGENMFHEYMNGNKSDQHLLCMGRCAYGERFEGDLNDIKIKHPFELARDKKAEAERKTRENKIKLAEKKRLEDEEFLAKLRKPMKNWD